MCGAPQILQLVKEHHGTYEAFDNKLKLQLMLTPVSYKVRAACRNAAASTMRGQRGISVSDDVMAMTATLLQESTHAYSAFFVSQLLRATQL